MKHLWIALPFSLLTLGILGGCAPAKTSTSAHHHGEASVVFEEGKGLLLSPSSLESMGVQLEEISPRPLQHRLTTSAQVYREASELSQGDYRQGYAYATAFIPAAMKDQLGKFAAVTLEKEGQLYPARSLRIDPNLEKAGLEAEWLLEIAASASLRQGDRLHAVAELNEDDSVLALPLTAILESIEGSFVYVRNGEHLLRTAVKTFPSQENRCGVLDGLFPGDTVAIQGVEALWLAELQATQGGSHCH